MANGLSDWMKMIGNNYQHKPLLKGEKKGSLCSIIGLDFNLFCDQTWIEDQHGSKIQTKHTINQSCVHSNSTITTDF